MPGKEDDVMVNLQEVARRELIARREQYDLPNAAMKGLWSNVQTFLDPGVQMHVHVKKDEITPLSLQKPFGDQRTQKIQGIIIDLPASHMDMSIGFGQESKQRALALVAVDGIIHVDDHTMSRYVKQYIVERDGGDYRFWHLLYGWPNWQEASGDLATMRLTRELFEIAKNQYVLTHSRGSVR